MFLTKLKKRYKADVPEAFIKEAIRAVQERRLWLRFAASRYGVTLMVLH
jgi:hypothetical protein